MQGCDGSILIAPAPHGAPPVERDMPENKNLAREGFETINMAKAIVESKCPGMVSCADILAIAARDFVHLVRLIYYDADYLPPFLFLQKIEGPGIINCRSLRSRLSCS